RQARPQAQAGRVRRPRRRRRDRAGGGAVMRASILVAALVGAAAAMPSAAFAAGTVPVDPGASALEGQLQAAAEAATPSIVQIRTSDGLGSGVVLDAQGDVVTNAHVVGRDKKVKVILSDGSKHEGLVRGSFPTGDLAAVRIVGATP